LGFLRALAAQLNIADVVSFIGFSNDVMSTLTTYDLFVITSQIEGLPNALAEAMAAGLPCLSLDFTAGATDLLGETYDEHFGQIITKRDPVVFGAALADLGKDATRRAACGKLNRDRIRKKFSIETYVKIFARAIGQIDSTGR